MWQKVADKLSPGRLQILAGAVALCIGIVMATPSRGVAPVAASPVLRTQPPVEVGPPVQVERPRQMQPAVERAGSRDASSSSQVEPAATLVDRIPVLMYHEIAAGPNALYTPPQEFAAQLDFLQRKGYNTISLQQMYDHFVRGAKLPAKPIVLTFDDGYVSFYTQAMPLMRQRGYSGTLFVITGFVGKPGYITWDQSREIDKAGMEVGAHTVNHLELSRLSAEKQGFEIAESRRVLEKELGHEVRFFCYPAGKYNATTMALVKDAGYLGAVTTDFGAATPKQDRREWERIRINQGTTPEALAALLRRAGADGN